MAHTGEITVEIDGKAMSFSASSLFRDVSEEIKKSIAPQRVLTEVLLDDRYVDIEEEERIGAQSLTELGRVAFRSKDVGALLTESLQIAPKICEALVLECEDIEEFLQKNDMQVAHERIAEMSSLVDWLLQLISGLQFYGEKEFRSTSTRAGSVIDSVQRMDECLNRLHSFMKNEDYTGFREILRGPFMKELDTWKEIFDKASIGWKPKSAETEQ